MTTGGWRRRRRRGAVLVRRGCVRGLKDRWEAAVLRVLSWGLKGRPCSSSIAAVRLQTERIFVRLLAIVGKRCAGAVFGPSHHRCWLRGLFMLGGDRRTRTVSSRTELILATVCVCNDRSSTCEMKSLFIGQYMCGQSRTSRDLEKRVAELHVQAPRRQFDMLP